MPTFDIDAQRGLICLFGMVCLATEAIAYYITGKALPGELTGIFGTCAIGPVLSATAQKLKERQDSSSTPPQSSSTPPPNGSEDA